MRTFLMYSIPILVLIALVLSIYYLSARLSWAFSLNKWLTLLGVSIVAIGSFVAMVMIMRGNYTSSLSHVISNITNITIGVLMFAVCAMLLLDLVNIFTKFQPALWGCMAICLTTLISGYSLWNASNTRIYNVDITLPNLTTPMRIAHISDTHFGHYWNIKKARELASIVKNEQVDAVVITGDMFDGRIRLSDDIIKPFTEIDAPIYFSEGNHDSYSGSSDIKKLLEKNGIIVLENEKVELNGLQIIGLDYLTQDEESVDNFHGSHSKHTIKSILPTMGIDPSLPSILLHHNPVGAKYAAENGINLYLAGHTHAGQIFPATLIAKMMFEYNKGLYKYNDNMQIYVSQGTGTFGPPMRLGTHSELTILHLK